MTNEEFISLKPGDIVVVNFFSFTKDGYYLVLTNPKENICNINGNYFSVECFSKYGSCCLITYLLFAYTLFLKS